MPKDPAVKRNRLANLRALEVSCVKSGANRRKWAIIKSSEADVTADNEIIPATLSDEQRDAIEAYCSVRDAAVQKDDAGVSALDDRQKAVLQAVFRMVRPFADTLSIDDLIAMGAQAGLQGTEEADGDEDFLDETDNMAEEPVAQAEEAPVDVSKDMNWQVPKPDGVSDDDHAKAMKSAKDAYMSAMGKTSKADDEMDKDEDSEDMAKADDCKDNDVKKSAQPTDEQKSYFEEVQKKHQALLTKCASLEGQIAEMRDEKVLKSYEDSLAADVPGLSIDRKATAKVLKSLQADKEAHDAYLATLKAAHEQVKVAKSQGGSLYGSVRGQGGQVAGYAAEAGSAQQRLDGMLNQQIQKSGNPDKSAAWAAIINDPEAQRLYEQSTLEGGI